MQKGAKIEEKRAENSPTAIPTSSLSELTTNQARAHSTRARQEVLTERGPVAGTPSSSGTELPPNYELVSAAHTAVLSDLERARMVDPKLRPAEVGKIALRYPDLADSLFREAAYWALQIELKSPSDHRHFRDSLVRASVEVLSKNSKVGLIAATIFATAFEDQTSRAFFLGHVAAGSPTPQGKIVTSAISEALKIQRSDRILKELVSMWTEPRMLTAAIQAINSMWNPLEKAFAMGRVSIAAEVSPAVLATLKSQAPLLTNSEHPSKSDLTAQAFAMGAIIPLLPRKEREAWINEIEPRLREADPKDIIWAKAALLTYPYMAAEKRAALSDAITLADPKRTYADSRQAIERQLQSGKSEEPMPRAVETRLLWNL